MNGVKETPLAERFTDAIVGYSMEIPCDTDDCPGEVAWRVTIHECCVLLLCDPCYLDGCTYQECLTALWGGVQCLKCKKEFPGGVGFHTARRV